MRIVSVIILLVACSCTSTPDDFCNRASSCNYLATSVDECVESLNSALGMLSDSERSAAEGQLQDCIDQSSCSEFASCIGALATAEDSRAQPRASDLLEIK